MNGSQCRNLKYPKEGVSSKERKVSSQVHRSCVIGRCRGWLIGDRKDVTEMEAMVKIRKIGQFSEGRSLGDPGTEAAPECTPQLMHTEGAHIAKYCETGDLFYHEIKGRREFQKGES